MDQQQQQAASLLAGMGFGAVLFVLVFTLAVVVFFVYLFWRIFAKAGLSGPLGLLCLIPGVGWLVALLVLAFSEWKVVPASTLYASGLPAYPPPTYPPSSYPPSTPPQL